MITQRTLKNSKRTQRTLQGHEGTQGTKALEHLRHLDTQRALEKLGTQGTCHLGTRVHEYLRYSGT